MTYSIIIQRRAAPLYGAATARRRARTAPCSHGAVLFPPCGADGPQTGAALLRGTARSVNAPLGLRCYSSILAG